MPLPVDLAQVLSTFTEPWSPRTVAVMNDYDVRVVRTRGEFTWHSHPDTDELFLVVAGSLTIRLESDEVTLGPGQLYVVPKGVRHQPFSAQGAEVVLIEPSETVNTGDSPSHLTAERRLPAQDSPHQPSPVTAAHRQLLRVLGVRTPLVREVAVWPGDLQLEMSAYVGAAELPDELVVSVRCLVSVGARVLVCQDAAPSVHVLPGGRREPGESWQRTAQREVMEETGWHVDPERMEMLGFIHVRHTSPVPDDHPFPHPDFLQVVMRGEGTGSPAGWVDSEGWVQRSWPASRDEAQTLPLPAISLAFLEHLSHR